MNTSQGALWTTLAILAAAVPAAAITPVAGTPPPLNRITISNAAGFQGDAHVKAALNCP